MVGEGTKGVYACHSLACVARGTAHQMPIDCRCHRCRSCACSVSCAHAAVVASARGPGSSNSLTTVLHCGIRRLVQQQLYVQLTTMQLAVGTAVVHNRHDRHSYKAAQTTVWPLPTKLNAVACDAHRHFTCARRQVVDRSAYDLALAFNGLAVRVPHHKLATVQWMERSANEYG
jgi:hypothetical protein